MKTGPEVNVPDATTRDTRTRVCPTGMQAMMGYWERLHPVNAVQIAELPHPVSPDDLQSAISRLFCKFLGADADSRWPMLKDDSNLNLTISEIRAEFRVLPETSDHRLESLVTELLNCPFSKDQPPFRVGIADAKHTRYVWLSYRHAIADARSISLLMQNLLEELAWAGAGELPLLVERDERSLSSFFPQKPR